jgi:antitoxin component HigA of HigAB toxin-antitoxin module
MAQIVDVIGYGPVEFPDGMSKEDMLAALKKLPPPPPPRTTQQPQAATPAAVQPTPQQIEKIATAQPPAQDITKPAFAAPRQRATALVERAAKVKEEEAAKYAYDDLHKNPDLLNKLTAYGSVRLGKTGLPQKGESSKDYVDRVVSHIRSVVEDPNPLRVTAEQEWINNSKPEDVVKAGEAYDLLENTASFFDPRGQAPLSALKDYAGLMLSNPLTYASLGVGKVAVNIVGKEAAKVGIKKALTTKIGATAAVSPLLFEGTSGTVTNVSKQKRELAVADATIQEMEKLLPSLSEEDQNKLRPKIEAERAKVDKGISVSEALTMGAIQAPFGLLEVAPLVAASTRGTKFLKGDKLSLKDLTDARKKQTEVANKPTALTGDEAADNVAVTTTNIYDGGDLLDMQGSPTSIAQMQVKNSIDKQADLIAASIWKQIPEFAPKAGEKTFEAVQRTLDSFDKLPDNVIKQSMTDAGTDLPNFMARLEAAGLDEDALKKFSSMYGVSTSDAARTLQSKSVISRMLNKMKEVDPEGAKAVDALFGKKASMGPVLDALVASKSFLDKVDRNMITAMTTNMSTVMRNAFGVGANLTYGAAEEGLESLIFNTGRKIAGKMRGSPVAGDIGKGFHGVIDDTVSGYFYLGQGDLSREITEEALKNNPMLMSKMLATAEDMKSSDLIAPVRILNTPAVIMDNYVRRAIFSASIDNNLRKAGLNLIDLMANDKNIPIDVLRQGVDDALTFTFSKTPTEGMGLAFVKGVEAARPISTAVFPFARFLVNATQWTAKHYNPWYTGKGAVEAIEGVRLLKNGDEAGSKLLLQGSEKIAQQATGMATLLAAYSYRKENQDSPWNVMKSDDGTNVDIKYLFPMNVPFALADFYYKIANGNPEDFKAMDLVEALTGFKSVGSTSESLERIKEVVSSVFTTDEKETDQSALNKVSRSAGDLIGAWLGRATVPLNQVSDIISAFDSNEALPRDIYVTKPDEERTFLTAVGKNIQKGIPILKQALPEYQPATRTQAAFRDTGPLKQMTGLALVPPKTEIETEIEARKIPFNAIFSTTGDKTVDAEARKFIANNIDNYIGPIISMDLYKKATDEGKAIDLKNALSELQNEAKKIAIDESIAKFYKMEKVPPVEQKQFEALPPKLRRITLEFYKQQTGNSFESDTDFKKYGVALEISKALSKDAVAVQKPVEKASGGAIGFNVGGFATKQIGKEVGSSAVVKSSMSLLKDMQDAAAKAAVKEAPVETVAAPVVKAPLVKSKTSPAVSQPKPVDAEMEKLVTEAEASFTPPPKVEPEVVPEIKTDLPMEAPAPIATPAPLSPYMKGVAEGDLNKAKYGFSRDSDIISDFEVRQNTLTAIKQMRTDAFDKLIEMPNVAGKVEDDVIAVAQGEYRAAKGKEVDVNDPKAVEDFVSFSMPLQEKLNKLREKYKDRPPKVLYHGTPYNAEERAAKGFFDPQTLPEDQAGQRELKVGATSFTDDARFNYANTSFGGTNPENIVQTSIPYADYEFRRINMSREQYKKKVGIEDMGDMNIIARSITGSPTVARPLGLPRSIGMRESEDAFTESEKLAISRNMYETEKKTPLFKQQEDIFNNSLDRLQEIKRNFLSPESLKPVKEGGLGSEEVQALKAYRLIRGIVRNEFRETGGKATSEAGLKAIVSSNQSTASRLSRLAKPSFVRNFDLGKFIPDVISTLEKVGNKDKAEALKVLEQQFNTLRKIDVDSSSPNAEVSAAIKRETEAVNAIRDLVGGSYRDKETKKKIGLAKGGLASRR